MSSNQVMIEKRKKILKKLTDLPQRVIVHKILIMYEFYIIKDEIHEIDPFLLFGYFLNDRLRNIWFMFPSINCRGGADYVLCTDVLENVIVDYSKLCHIDFDGVRVPNSITLFSQRMYSLRSVSCNDLGWGGLDLNDIVHRNFFNSKFPKLERFSLETTGKSIGRSWNESEFFDQLKSLKLFIVHSEHFASFFRKKEIIFGRNLNIISLSFISLKEKVIISLPNLKVMSLIECFNLYVIPSHKKLRKAEIVLDDILEVKKIAFESRNAEFIVIEGDCVQYFYRVFQDENLPNLRILIAPYFPDDFRIEEEWKFSFRLKELTINLNDNYMFFTMNKWDQLVKLELLLCIFHFVPYPRKKVKFPNLQFLKFSSCVISNDFFVYFEGKKLERIEFIDHNKLTGKGWCRDIYRSIRVLGFKDEFDDSFFQENEFPNLKKLKLDRNKTLKDQGSWKEMKNLEEIKAYGCKYIGYWKRK